MIKIGEAQKICRYNYENASEEQKQLFTTVDGFIL